MEHIGVAESKHRSCAALALQCLTEVGIAEQQNIFRHHIENAKTLGLMPDDLKVVRATLRDYGFAMQSSHVENIELAKAIAMLSDAFATSVTPAVALVLVRSYKHTGGYMLALRTDGDRGLKPFLPDCNLERLEPCEVIHVWIRWNDGIDRSSFPRKRGSQRSSAHSDRTKQDGSYYCFYQPNPCGNSIGDCVVRGISGAMDISWREALELLASFGEVTVNSRNVYSQLLMREGFIHHKPIVRDGRRLKGADFCKEMDDQYHNGERIFAHVGRSHVAAIVPTEGSLRYKLMDSWDSSQSNIGDYWVKPVRIPSTPPDVKKDAKSVLAGDSIRHPSFGVGVVIAAYPGVLAVDFGDGEVRRLEEKWVLKNCACACLE